MEVGNPELLEWVERQTEAAPVHHFEIVFRQKGRMQSVVDKVLAKGLTCEDIAREIWERITDDAENYDEECRYSVGCYRVNCNGPEPHASARKALKIVPEGESERKAFSNRSEATLRQMDDMIRGRERHIDSLNGRIVQMAEVTFTTMSGLMREILDDNRAMKVRERAAIDEYAKNVLHREERSVELAKQKREEKVWEFIETHMLTLLGFAAGKNGVFPESVQHSLLEKFITGLTEEELMKLTTEGVIPLSKLAVLAPAMKGILEKHVQKLEAEKGLLATAQAPMAPIFPPPAGSQLAPPPEAHALPPAQSEEDK